MCIRDSALQRLRDHLLHAERRVEARKHEDAVLDGVVALVVERVEQTAEDDPVNSGGARDTSAEMRPISVADSGGARDASAGMRPISVADSAGARDASAGMRPISVAQRHETSDRACAEVELSHSWTG
eukprot:1014593-Prymnesium_polylepis.1